jgi:hypothetical protein
VFEFDNVNNVVETLVDVLETVRVVPSNFKFVFPNAAFAVPVAVRILLATVEPTMLVNPGPVGPV